MKYRTKNSKITTKLSPNNKTTLSPNNKTATMKSSAMFIIDQKKGRKRLFEVVLVTGTWSSLKTDILLLLLGFFMLVSGEVLDVTHVVGGGGMGNCT